MEFSLINPHVFLLSVGLFIFLAGLGSYLVVDAYKTFRNLRDNKDEID